MKKTKSKKKVAIIVLLSVYRIITHRLVGILCDDV